MAPSPIRPTPVRDQFTDIPIAVRYIATILSGVAGGGAAFLVTDSAVFALAGLALALPPFLGDLFRQWRQWRAVAAAQAQVTPLSDPVIVRDGQLELLVPISETRGRHARLDEAP